MSRTFELMQQVARKLTGRYVAIRFTPPANPRADGMTWRDRGGAINVHLHPKLKGNPARLFSVFLHELAHAKLHGTQYTKQAHAPPVSYDQTAAKLAAPIVTRHESEADALAATWENYARANWRACQEATELDAHLRTLTYWST